MSDTELHHPDTFGRDVFMDNYRLTLFKWLCHRCEDCHHNV